MKAQLTGADVALLRAALRKRAETRLEPVRQGISRFDWTRIARSKQIPPGEIYQSPDGPRPSASDRTDWRYWLIKAGRGFGKTKTGGETVRRQVQTGRRRSIALVGATLDDAYKYMIAGKSGLLTITPQHERPRWFEKKRTLEWPNGAKGYVYTAEEPERLRGPEHDLAWCDELGSWKYPEATWANLRFTMRARGPLGDRPQYIITTTPRPIPLVFKLIKDKLTVVTSGDTYENASNLDDDYIEGLKEDYEGTRLGLQEIYGEVLSDNPDALWKSIWIEDMRVQVIPELDRIVIGIDPAVTSKKTSDATGIVTAGVVRECHALPSCDGGEHGFVFDDSTGIYTPAEWAGRVAVIYNDEKADRAVAEINQGGDLVEANLRANGLQNIPYRGIHAARGVATRAEPVSALYEQRKIHHHGNLSKLEDHMTQWNPKIQLHAPDRVSALVVALTDLMMGTKTARYHSPRTSHPRRI
jgi:phage terminase large subunit-like protein